MRFVWGVIFSAALVPTAVASEIDVAGGIEYFQWQEYSDSGSKYLDETGPRYFVEVVGTNRLESDWYIDFGGRFYSGTVDYDGGTLPPNSQPVNTDTDYNGVRAELGFTHELGRGISERDRMWLLRFAIGIDQWRRSLQDTTLADGRPVYGYVERYASTYAKIGATYLQEGVWSFGIGAKAPFHTSEEIEGFQGISGNVTLNPEGRLSLFAAASVFLDAHWSIAVAYDSYRFAKSDPVVAGGFILTQPESTQDTLSLALHYRF